MELWSSDLWEIPFTRLRRVCPDRYQAFAAPYVIVPDVDVRFDVTTGRWHIRPRPTHPMWAIGISRVVRGLSDALARVLRFGWHTADLFIAAVELLVLAAVRDREVGREPTGCEYCARCTDIFCHSCGAPLLGNVAPAERAQFVTEVVAMWRLQIRGRNAPGDRPMTTQTVCAEANRIRWVEVDVQAIESAEECQRLLRLLEEDRDRIAQTIARWRDAARAEHQYVELFVGEDKFRRTEDAQKGMRRKYVALQARLGTLNHKEKRRSHLELVQAQDQFLAAFRTIARERLNAEVFQEWTVEAARRMRKEIP